MLKITPLFYTITLVFFVLRTKLDIQPRQQNKLYLDKIKKDRVYIQYSHNIIDDLL